MKNLFLLPIIFLFLSCSFGGNSLNYKKDAKLFIHGAISNGKSFTFVVNDKFSNQGLEIDKKYRNITKKELKILRKLLRKNSYCINNNGDLLFKIMSRQEKVYDVTLSGLIEQQYNAKSLTPVTYFGKCL